MVNQMLIGILINTHISFPIVILGIRISPFD